MFRPACCVTRVLCSIIPSFVAFYHGTPYTVRSRFKYRGGILARFEHYSNGKFVINAIGAQTRGSPASQTTSLLFTRKSGIKLNNLCRDSARCAC